MTQNNFALQVFKSPDDPETLRIIPMGGCGEFGMNLTAYLFQNRLYVVDCGLRFPDQGKLGIDAVIPAVDSWFAAAGGVYAYIITHGHEDHIGALPHIIRRWPAPVYAPPWAAALLKLKFARRGIDKDQHPITVVEAGDRVRVDGFDIEYVHVNHSIPNACALFIRTPRFNVFHTGDFKYEADPVIEPPMNLAHLKALGQEGVHLLLADSTNADKPGLSPGEKSVTGPLTRILKEASGAVLLTTFSSNLWRLKSIVDACIAANRKIYVAGTGLETTIAIAKELGLYDIPDNLRIQDAQLDTFPRSRLVVLATGCQGESRAALARIAYGEHRAFAASPEDTVVLSSRIIPGNEKAVLAIINQFKRLGVRIVTTQDERGIHVSGHAYQGDVNLLFEHLQPRFFTPVHGAFSQLRSNFANAADHENHAVLIETGDVIDVDAQGVSIVDHIDVDVEYIDGESSVILSYETVRERLRIGELGCAILTGVFARAGRKWLVSPEIDFQGIRLPYDINPDTWLSAASARVASHVKSLYDQGTTKPEDLREEARITLRRLLHHTLGKKPVVLSKLHIV